MRIGKDAQEFGIDDNCTGSVHGYSAYHINPQWRSRVSEQKTRLDAAPHPRHPAATPFDLSGGGSVKHCGWSSAVLASCVPISDDIDSRWTDKL